MTVGFHSPLPPARTGVAEYSGALLEALRRRGSIVPNAADADVHLYHLGNNQIHREIYSRALAVPGVVVLHDAVLHHYFLGSLDRAAYAEEFVFNYGEWLRGLAEELWAGRARSASDERYFRYPMLRRVCEISKAVIVHNPGAARMVRVHAPAASVHQVPHLYLPPPEAPSGNTERFREQLQIPESCFIWSVLGYIRESKRLPAVFRAFDEVRKQGVEGALVVAGEFVSQDLERSVAPWFSRPDVRRVGWLPETDFWRLAAAAHGCLNLRHPTAGETSGITIRLMGLGKPVIITESEETSEFPEGTCLRVAHGIAEESELAGYMALLAADRRLAQEIGRRAAAHIRERHSIDQVADSYWEILCGCRG